MQQEVKNEKMKNNSQINSSGESSDEESPKLPKRNLLSHEVEKKIESLIPSNSSPQKKEFFLKFLHFLASKGNLPEKLPTLGYKVLDLYNLYHLVTSQGGYNQMNQ